MKRCVVAPQPEGSGFWTRRSSALTILPNQGEGLARRKRQSVAEDAMDAVALLPWWAGLALALASYVVFHTIASRPLAPIDPRQVAAAIPGMYLRGIAGALQYIAPIVCLVGAAVSFFRRKKRDALVANTTASTSADALNGMTWQEFEMLTAEAFRLQGFEVKEQGGASPDGGVDLVARKGGETYLVQCKQWRAFKVGVDVVRELYGVMAAQGAAGGYVVTSGQFTQDARAFAEGRNVRLVDGPKLFGLLQQARTSLGSKRAPPSAAPPVNTPKATAAEDPLCPVCSAAMVRRTAKKGATPGSQFWGCSRFPACRGTR